jgi:hypothetical protein
MSDLSPKPYGKTRESEITAISIFENLIDRSRVNTFIVKDNTIPDTDGSIVINDELTIPRWKFEVQIKKLPNDNEGNPKIRCPVSIFGYAKTFIYPFLFIVVDIHNKRAYWICIDDELINQYNDKIEADQDTVTIYFPKENYIDGTDTRYVEAWEKIYENKARKIINYPNLERQYALLKEHSNLILDVSRPEFIEIHTFLDNLNRILETQFSIVNKVFFSNSWKLGIAYNVYKDDSVSYALYPIPLNKNDVQIKFFDEELKTKLIHRHFEIKSHFMENPIKRRSLDYAFNIVEEKVLKILKNRLLDHRNEYLAREYIFAFIDNFNVQLGLEIKNTYSIDEIEIAFSHYLPHWTYEAVQHLITGKGKNKISSSHHIFQRFFIDPDLIITFLMPEDRASVHGCVTARIEKNEPIPRIRMDNEKFPVGIFYELFTFIKSLNVKQIRRIYSPKDYERLRRKRTSWIWDVYSSEQVKENILIFFENLNSVYSLIVDTNFPEFKIFLSMFGDANRIVIVYDIQEEYDMQHFPSIEYHFFVDESLDEIVFEIYNSREIPESLSIDQIRSGKDLLVNGRKCKKISDICSTLDFIFDDTPMMNYCYQLLEENLKRHFLQIKNLKGSVKK